MSKKGKKMCVEQKKKKKKKKCEGREKDVEERKTDRVGE